MFNVSALLMPATPLTMCTFSIVRPPVREVFCFARDVSFFCLFSTRNLQAPSVDPRETSPHDRNMCEFYKLTLKIRGWGLSPPKKRGGDSCKNSVDFIGIQPSTLITNIYGMAQDIQQESCAIAKMTAQCAL